MRIFEMRAENMASLQMVEIKPRKGVTLISGPNGAGKSAVLSVPSWALGGKSALPEVPVRLGEKSGRVSIAVGGEEVEFIVSRVVDAETGDTKLTVTAPNGATFKRPQEMISKWFGALSFDAGAFMRMKPADQLAELQRIAPLPPAVGTWRSERQAAYDERTIVNRRAKELAGKLAGEPEPAALPFNAGDVDELTADLATVGAENAKLEAERLARRVELAKARDMQDRGASMIIEAERMLQEGKAMREAGHAREVSIGKLDPVPADVDAGAILRAIEVAREAERTREKIARRRELEADLAKTKAEADKLSKLIDDHDFCIREAIAKAKMPVRGLSYGDDGILFNGLPLSQASTAQALRVSMGIAMATNPELRVLFVREWSLLDQESRETVEDLAAEEGFDVIGEVVGDSPVGFVMRGGRVVAVDGEPVEAL